MIIFLIFSLPVVFAAYAVFFLRFVKSNYGGIIVLLIFSFILEGNFRVGRDEITGGGVDFQMLIKACAWLGCFVLSFFWILSRKNYLSIIFGRWQGGYFLAWFGSSLFSSLLSDYLGYSLFYTLLLFLFFVVAGALVGSIGHERGAIEKALLFFMKSYLFASIAVLFLIPELGYVEYWSGGVIAGTRFTGLSASANGIGRVLALCIILLVSMYLNSWITRKTFLFYLAIPLFLLVLSWSRSAIILTFICSFVMLITKNPERFLKPVMFMGVIFIIILIILMPFINDVLLAFSRTGDINEMMTLTGRTDIWSAVLDSIYLKPLLGWGYGISKFELPLIFEGDWGWVTGSAHNLFLQALFSIGIIGTVFFSIFLIKGGWAAYRSKDIFFIGVSAYVLFSGLTESSAFGPTPNFLTFVWFLLYVRSAYEEGFVNTSK